MVMDLTWRAHLNAADAGTENGVVEVTKLPAQTSPKALCWKSVTLAIQNFCYGDIHRRVLCAGRQGGLASPTIDVGGPRAMQIGSVYSTLAFVRCDSGARFNCCC